MTWLSFILRFKMTLVFNWFEIRLIGGPIGGQMMWDSSDLVVNFSGVQVSRRFPFLSQGLKL